MYTDKNYRTKKALKEAVKNGDQITVYQSGGQFGTPSNGRIGLEGPHYPEPHKWYASATLKDGVVVKVS